MPLSGTLPDMKAQSADYIELQNIYKSKARRDIQAVTTLVREIEKQYSLSNPVDEREIEVFCKNAQYMRLIRGKEDSSILTKRTGIYPLWLSLRR
jgi:NEDD8-activating enzyme E1 regulatory subunit